MSHAHEHRQELLAAYVLGACPEPEADGVAEHLAGCASCAATAEWLREGTDLLLLDVAPEAPGEAVKDRVMSQVRAEAELFEAARGARLEPSEPDQPLPTRTRWRLPPMRLRAPAAVAALASILILAAVGIGLLSGGLGSGSPPREVVAARIDDRQARGASGTLETRGERAELRVNGLRSPGRGRVYQVWVRKDRQVPEPAGAVLDAGSGRVARARLSKDIHRFDQVLVTSEPAGGSRLPTRVPVLDVDTPA